MNRDKATVATPAVMIAFAARPQVMIPPATAIFEIKLFKREISKTDDITGTADWFKSIKNMSLKYIQNLHQFESRARRE